MDLKGICISTGSACDSETTEVSHVVKSIDVPDEYAVGTIRISFEKSNMVEEIDCCNCRCINFYITIICKKTAQLAEEKPLFFL